MRSILCSAALWRAGTEALERPLSKFAVEYCVTVGGAVRNPVVAHLLFAKYEKACSLRCI